ncbi:amphi-Trp domain-containing protein [Desulfonema magnum]|uniref:Amphi-Trp domain-containing protein n=1 Tax=Desulfonema magnum TaxID=45655 RepID=A0A975GTZ9_9BACT|nr:amphi-Trp domain-containing protein [Desulfonema magnum]QTA93629.1 Amphi-Trp domain-containing protein [Desulfonema magnum]
MKKSEVKIKKTMDADAVKTILDDVVKSFKEGTVCIESGKEFVVLKPSQQIDFEIEAGEKKGKEKLVIEMSWRQDALEQEPQSLLKISSSEPVVEEPSPEKEEEVSSVKEEQVPGAKKEMKIESGGSPKFEK